MSELSGIDNVVRAVTDLEKQVADETGKIISHVSAASEGRSLESEARSGMRELAAQDLPGASHDAPDPGIRHLPQMEADGRWPTADPAQADHAPGAGAPGHQDQTPDAPAHATRGETSGHGDAPWPDVPGQDTRPH